jgi:hypothetical protein
MKIKINNLVELVNALEKYGSLYYENGTELKFAYDKRYVCTVKDDGVWRELDLTESYWLAEFETVVPLKDKQAVWCWDRDTDTHRVAKFYDEKNNATFGYTGYRSGVDYKYYEPIPMNDDGSYPKGFEWMEEAQTQLED